MAKRKPEQLQPVEPDEVKTAEEVRAENDSNRSTLTDLENEREAMLQPFASELPVEKELLMVETKWFLAHAAVAFVEIGRRLIVLKERAEHGEWYEILNELNIEPRTASRSMRVAQKFGGLKSMLHLDPTKLIALLDVPDSEIKQIEESGTVLGMNVDAIDAMTVRQLKKKLRAGREKEETGRVQLQRAADELREKDAKILALQIGPQTDTEYMRECSEVQMEFSLARARLRRLFNQAQTETQRRALIGTLAHAEKEDALIGYDIRAEFDPTSEDAPADRDMIEKMADDINWHAPTVIEFLKKCNTNGEGEDE